MKIVTYSSTDQNAVVEFWKTIFAEMHWKVLPTDGFDDIPSLFHLPQGFLLIVKDQEKIVGCGGVKPLAPTFGLLKRFYVAMDVRGKGVAKELLDKIIAESKSRGLKELVLDVFYTNVRAVRFYEKHGFTKYAQLPDPEWPQSQSPDKFFYYKLNI